MEKIRVLNIDVLCITEHQLLEGLDKNLSGDYDGSTSSLAVHNGVLITPNLDHLVKLQKDEEFYRCYQDAEWVVCDSKILCLCSKMLKRSFPEPIPGSSFFTHFYEYHNAKCDRGEKQQVRIFLLGSSCQATADEAMRKINEKCGRQMVVGAHSPSFGFEKKEAENRELVRIIRESGANVVLVGVGAPKQEKWIMRWKDEMPEVKIWMALGATIAFEAGHLRRAPKLFQKLALEWLFRIWCEPKRMFKRYICDDLVFFWYLTKQMCGKYRNPFEENKAK